MHPQESNKDTKPTGYSKSVAPGIEMPKGGGAMKGIDEKFSVNAVNGTSGMSIGIPMQMTRSDFAPGLTLSYNSGTGNSEFGLGWGLSLPSIQRKTDKRLPEYNDIAESDVFLFAGAEDLVPVIGDVNHPNPVIISGANGFTITRYRPRVEGLFARIEKIQPNGQSYFYWRVTTKDNINTYFGLQASSRLSDPKNVNRIYKWLPDMSFDDKGNVHVFEYKAEDLVNVPKAVHEQHRHNGLQEISNLYLKRVYYGNKTPYSFGTASAYAPTLPQTSDFLYTTVFDYGEHDTQNPTIYDDIPNNVSNTHRWSCRKDAFSDYHAGFEIRTYRLCKRVLSFSIFEELNPGATGSAKLTPHLIQSIDLTYKHKNIGEVPGDTEFLIETNYITEATHWMYRKNATDYDKKKLPPMKFTYNEVNWDTSIHNITKESLVHAPTGLSSGYQWMDFYGEGISGILTEQAEGWYYKSNWGDGSFSPAQKIAPKPNFTGLQLQDLEANGKKYAVSNTIGAQGYFELDDDDKWQNFRPFKHIPNIDYNNANTRMLDLNGDGMPDILITQERVFTYYEAKGIEGYGQAKTTTHPLDENKGPSVVFADSTQSIFLADMSGDGMIDIVRIRNKDICYWPNLGYGKFGAKVTMSDAPLMDRPDQFNPAYIHLSDISGTGASDIIYLGKNQFRAWLNQSGNGWGKVQEINPFPQSELPNTLSVIDLLGNGTSCLVWSSPLPQYSNSPMRYIDLMGGNKPYLMKQYDNSAGKQVSLTYKSSTHYYLEDKKKGKPWITKLPFPVHCVQKTETKDLIAGTTYSNLYSYHHGYYDHAEREFRGFGRVETLDTETFVNPNAQGTLDEPPVLTKTWYHTGAWIRKDKILNHYKDEYFKPTGTAFTELDLVQPDLPTAWTAIEQREALRALKGVPLRQEVYAKDASVKEHLPYSATEYNYDIQLLQAKSNNRFAVFLVHEKENIAYHYERNDSDPRIAHSLNIVLDKYANVLESASVVYGRVGTVTNLPTGASQTIINEGQKKPHVVYTVNEYTKFIYPVGSTTEVDDLETEKNYRLRVPWRMKQYELTKVVATGATLSLTDKYFKVSDLQSNFASASEIDYSATASTTVVQKRLIEAQYSLFYDDTASTPLAEHLIESKAILYEGYRLAFTEDLLDQVYGATKVPTSSTKLTTDGRYVEKNYTLATGNKKYYWIPSGTISYTNDNYTGTPVSVNAEANFYLPMSFTDPFGHTTHLKYYGAYHFLLEATKDALLNETKVLIWEWRTMQVQKIEDINGNHNVVTYDILGLPVGMAMLGKGNDHTDTEADSLLNFVPDLTAQQLTDFFNDPVTNAPALLAHATTRFIYDYENYFNNQSPLRVATITREIHDKKVSVTNPLKLQLAFEYSDGLGRILMKKAQAEAGLYYVSGSPTPVDSGTALRWVGTGRTILNNKGKPIKQYEPYFSGTHQYESDTQLVQVGYSPILYYDAVGRVIRTDMPDGTYSKVEFDAWMQRSYDANDTVGDSGWRADRETGGALVNVAEEVDAKNKTLQHADTPSVVHTDSLARPFYTIQHNKKLEESTTNPGTYVWVEEFLCSYVVMDIESNTKEIHDARGNIQLQYKHDILGNIIYQKSIDGAERWMLNDVFGKPIYGWDSMNQVARNVYDVLHRPTDGYIKKGNATERKISSITYGENQSNDKLKNLRGKPFMSRDGGGESKMLLYDFKGQALESSLQILDDATIIDIDWTANPTLNSSVYKTIMEYDALGRPIKHTDPGSNETRHIYNEAGLLNEVWMKPSGASDKQYVSNIDYNAKGQREAIWYGNGSKTKYTYHLKNYRLTRLKTTRINSSNQLVTFQDLNYYYDAVGNITTLRDDAQDAIYFNNAIITATQKYTYDALYRLIKSEGREMFNGKDEVNNNAFTPFSQIFPATNGNALLGYAQYYDYDAVGNIRKLDHNAGANSYTRFYNYNSGDNRLVSTKIGASGTPITYAYDSHGNMTDMPHLHQMQWNALDQLSVVATTLATADKTYYQYSGGQRIRKYSINSNVIEERIYLGNYELYRQVTSGTEKVKREAVHIADDTGRIAMYENRLSGNSGDDNNTDATLIRYIYSNHLQSSSLELSDGGEIISYEEYHPYGTTSYHAASSGIKATAKRYRYTGKERDNESGLYYHGARYYIPWLARWCAVDPLEAKYAGLSSYNYSFNNPVMFNDPSGKGPGEDEEIPTYIKAPSKATKQLSFDGGLPHFVMMLPEVIIHGEKSKPTIDLSTVGTYTITVTDSGTSGSSGSLNDSPTPPWLIRTFGAVQMVGGVTESVIGGVGGVLTSETGVGAVVGYGVMVHGADNASAGFMQLWTGEYQKTFTEQGISYGLQSVGVKKDNADYYAGWANAYLGVAGTGGGVQMVDNTAVNITKSLSLEKSVEMTSFEANQIMQRISTTNFENSLAKIDANTSGFSSWITKGSLPLEEEEALTNTIKHIQQGTKPTGALAKKWATPFRNSNGDLPGVPGAGGYLEYRVSPPSGVSGAGVRRVVTTTDGKIGYYTWTHYGDTGQPAFVRIW